MSLCISKKLKHKCRQEERFYVIFKEFCRIEFDCKDFFKLIRELQMYCLHENGDKKALSHIITSVC